MLEMARDVHRSPADTQDVIPPGIPRDGWERPKIRDKDDPTKLVAYQRPSKFGEKIEPTYQLDRREDILVTAAFVRFPLLFDDAAAAVDRAVRGGEAWDEVMANKLVKAELDRIRRAAIEQMGGNRRADQGTAFHEQRHLIDTRGEQGLVLTEADRVRLAAWSSIASCFDWHGSEQFVVCDRWQTAGTYDALWSPRWPIQPPEAWEMPALVPGERFIVDLKSGDWIIKYGEVAKGVQLTQYPHGVPYVHVEDGALRDADCVECGGEGAPCCDTPDNGRREWPDGQPPRTDVAIIPHIPYDRPEDAGLLLVDLRLGARMSDCAREVFEIRSARVKGRLLAPVELQRPAGGLEMAVTVEDDLEAEPEPLSAQDAIFAHLERTRLETLIRATRVPAHLDTLRTRYAAVWSPQLESLAAVKAWELGVSA